jgi:hypothetical protein
MIYCVELTNLLPLRSTQGAVAQKGMKLLALSTRFSSLRVFDFRRTSPRSGSFASSSQTPALC